MRDNLKINILEGGFTFGGLLKFGGRRVYQGGYQVREDKQDFGQFRGDPPPPIAPVGKTLCSCGKYKQMANHAESICCLDNYEICESYFKAILSFFFEKCARFLFTLNNFQQNCIHLENATLKHFQYRKQLLYPLETVIKKTDYLSSYFEKIHNLLLFKTFDLVLQQLLWLLCLIPYKLAFSGKCYTEKVLLMFILQATTEGVPKKQWIQEITISEIRNTSKSVQVNL